MYTWNFFNGSEKINLDFLNKVLDLMSSMELQSEIKFSLVLERREKPNDNYPAHYSKNGSK